MINGLAAAISAVAPRVSIAIWALALEPWMQSEGIVTPRRVAALLAQCSEETGAFKVLVENLDYSAERLCQVWPARFPTPDAAAPFARNPERLANHVYAGRDGNGDEASGDGWRFRGRGLIQITGRANYAAAARGLGKALDDMPAWLETPAGAAAAACWWWTNAGCNAMADRWDLEAITRRVNGGLVNLSTRMVLSERALSALHGVEPQTPAMPESTTTADSAEDLNAAELATLGGGATA